MIQPSIDLRFIHEGVMNSERREYGTNNVAHCFSRSMTFPQWLSCFDKNTIKDLRINGLTYDDFLLGSDKSGEVKKEIFYHIPMPIHFVIKHRNQGKIESHKWFFKGFCEYMQPDYVQIIDCGSIPLWNSISRIVKYLEKHSEIGAATGEIEVILPEKNIETGQEFTFNESILLKSQYVEYKTATYLDKAMESLFSFVSVLPGAFSTFRWECINGHPLDEFLKGSKDEFGSEASQMSCSTANRYLAEDRIMCLEILAREGNWTISYVPGAKCLTDPPITLKGLMKQRRRWYNGSLFATYFVINNLKKVI